MMCAVHNNLKNKVQNRNQVIRELFISFGPKYQKNGIWAKCEGALWEKDKIIIGRNGKVGRDGFWAKYKIAKMKLGETAKGQDRYWAEREKGEVGKG